ncbi:reverse transcriptase domain, Reverse transcriptase zinc-binding domain protein [Artemisia annua]|uniref:Reverse transcriptase domain, Reverse transcriptase zinc-binding domain protein n=1 Tax=Artemisia annua TaxID=35608 RepID=A0A2U1LE25_ARTAN|nr:reverse transcriptase domain, Reverse transcriptase zinc-binding domain protein [Artemisia annua]
MQESEDLEHLFFNCEFSRGVWEKIKIKAGIHINGDKLGEIVLTLANGNNGNNIGSLVNRLCFAASVYSIWFERNKIIFRDEKKEAEHVVKTILDTVKLKLMCLKVKDSGAVRLIESLSFLTDRHSLKAFSQFGEVTEAENVYLHTAPSGDVGGLSSALAMLMVGSSLDA